MKAFLALARIRVLDVLRSRSSASFVLVFPVVLLLVVGLVFSRGHPFETRTVVVCGGDEEVARVRAALTSIDGVRVQPARTFEEGWLLLESKMASAIVNPVTGHAPQVHVMVTEREHLFGRGLQATLPSVIELHVRPEPRWGYVRYLFPGVLTFSVMLAGLFATGYTMVLYRQNRFLKKLATTPMRKTTFVAAQVAARSLLVLGQVALLFAAGGLVFGVIVDPWRTLSLAAITALGLLAFMGIGFVLACVIRTEDLVVDIISAVNLPLVFLSEIFFPLDALPAPLAAVGGVLPSTAMVRLCRTVLVGVAERAELAPGLALLAAWAVLSFFVGLRLFRWHQ